MSTAITKNPSRLTVNPANVCPVESLTLITPTTPVLHPAKSKYHFVLLSVMGTSNVCGAVPLFVAWVPVSKPGIVPLTLEMKMHGEAKSACVALYEPFVTTREEVYVSEIVIKPCEIV